jgi:hypothetical protein
MFQRIAHCFWQQCNVIATLSLISTDSQPDVRREMKTLFLDNWKHNLMIALPTMKGMAHHD